MKDDLPYLLHLRDALEEVREFLEGMKYEDFVEDKRTRNAVLRSFEVMGEASRRVSPEFRAGHPEIPWRKIMNFRNKLIHDYFGLDYLLVWKTAQEEVPSLLPLIMGLIGQMKE
jgi:uncharacterized protein with HEPN domain